MPGKRYLVGCTHRRNRAAIYQRILTHTTHDIHTFSTPINGAMVQYLAPIPEVERGDLMSAYYRRLTGNDDKVKQECASAWSVWYLSLSLSLARAAAFAHAPPPTQKTMRGRQWVTAF